LFLSLRSGQGGVQVVVGKAEVRVHTGVVCARADNAAGCHPGPPQPGHEA